MSMYTVLNLQAIFNCPSHRYLIMIGAMPAVAVRHERRKNTRDHPDAEPGLLHGPSKNIRPRGSNPLKLRPTSPSSAAAATLVLASGAGNAKASVSPSSSSGDPHLLRVPPTSEPATASIGNVTDGSLANSRTGSPVDADPAVVLMYGDECCYAKVSLLHFIVFFILGGITVIIIGAVQVRGYLVPLNQRISLLFCFSFMKKPDYQGTDINSSWREYSLSHLASYYYSSSAIGFVNLFLFSTRKNRPSTKSQS